MDFPNLIPSSRAFEAGDYPIKSFKSQNGSEVRLLYGSRRTGMTMTLSYDNIADTQAEKFIEHYHEMRGTYRTFTVDDLEGGMRTGWEGDRRNLGAFAWGNEWRYAGPPTLQSVRSGRSSVQVKLVTVL
jgi:hypothetical protein